MSLERASRLTQPLAIAGLVLVLAYLFVILWAPALGPLDDHELLGTLYAGKRLGFYMSPLNGRFYPLDAQELNLVAIFSTSPFAFYLVNAAQLVVIALFFFDLNRRLSDKTLALAALVFLLLTPGFANAWTRLQIPERGEIFFFTLMLWCYVRFQSTRGILPFLGVLAAANVALYYKEPAFLSIGTFGVARLVLEWRNRERTTRLLDVLLAASAAGFLLAYYLVIYRHHHDTALYGQVAFSGLLVVVRGINDFAISDPLIMLGVPAMVLWRVFRILRTGKTEPLADAMLVAALAYIPVFFLIGMLATSYYLLPTYAFALPAFCIYWRNRVPADRPLWRVGGAIVLVITLIGSLPLALFSLSFNKNVARNHSGAVAYLSKAIAAQPGNTAIYIDGATPEKQSEIFFSLRRYLVAGGVPAEKFTLKPLMGWQAPGPQAGDYLIISPFDFANTDAQSLGAMSGTWNLVFASHSPLAVPNLSLRVAVKYLATHYLLRGSDIGATNQFVYPVDYQILVKR